MNLIQYASKKERVHVEQIIREQPVLKDADNVTIKTISVRKSLGLTMDVFAPAAVSDEPLPVLVDIHGGGLIAGRNTPIIPFRMSVSTATNIPTKG